MGAGGFEPPNANARGFTIPALWPLGYTPQVFSTHTLIQRAESECKSHLSDSNRGPADYKSAALSTELRWRDQMSFSLSEMNLTLKTREKYRPRSKRGRIF